MNAKTEVVMRSGRRSCICFALEGRLDGKKGQMAHLDRNPQHSTADNLAFLCMDHHDEYDTRASQSKGWSIKEVKEYRRLLYRAIADLREVKTGDIATAVDVAVLDIGHNLYAWDRGGLPRIKADYHLLAGTAAGNDHLLLERDLADFSSETLGGVSLIILVCPRDAHYTQAEIDNLVRFVGSGGLLLILAYYWWRCDHDTNIGDLTAKFQITLQDDRIYDPTDHDRNEYRLGAGGSAAKLASVKAQFAENITICRV